VPTSRHVRRRRPVATLCATALLLAFAATAAATAPVKGGAYKGALIGVRSYIKVSFKVSKSGKTVTGLRTTDLPFYCSGGGRAVPITFKKATISKSGTFTSTGKDIVSVGPLKGHVAATLTITGRFLPRRRESGTIKTVFVTAHACDGSSSYSTKA
jgi:hypothetical protein